MTDDTDSVSYDWRIRRRFNAHFDPTAACAEMEGSVVTGDALPVLHVFAIDERGDDEVLIGLELTDARVENVNKARELFDLVVKGGGDILEVTFRMSGMLARKIAYVDFNVSGGKCQKYLHGHISEEPLFDLEDDEGNESRDTSTFVVDKFGVYFTFTSRFNDDRYVSMPIDWVKLGLGPKLDSGDEESTQDKGASSC